MRGPVFCLLLSLMVSCGSDGGTDAVTPDVAAVDAVEASSPPPPDTVEPEESLPPPAFPEDFAVAFVYKGIVPGENDKMSDLYLVTSSGMNPMAPEVESPVALTGFAIDPNECQLVLEKAPDGTPLSTAPCSCHLGCVVDETLTWIAVTVEKPSDVGFAFQVGKFNADLQVKMVKGAVFKDIVDMAFAGGYLYFSSTQYCSDTGCKFLVYRYDLENIPAPQSLFLIPPDDDPDFKDGQATTDGHFTASADGKTLAFLSPTIRSQRVYVWRNEVVKELDYQCPGGMQGDHCTGSGSEFSDLDPLAMTPSGKKLAWFSRIKDRLVLRLYDTDGGNVKEQVLLDTAGQDFNAASCAQLGADPWKFNRVSNPLFTPDAQTLLFVASSNCDPSKKPFTDIVSIPVNRIGGGPLTADTLTDITDNPTTNDVTNAVIEGFDLSPTGGNVVYNASPVYGQDKKTQLPETSAKAKQSRELWVAAIDGSEKRQITFNQKQSAIWLKAVPTPEIGNPNP
jgi:hypothetical protein